jgi:uroporphyrin-III C-methyltransferase/precorrin-2 dehydrogenase/sirohydrochlorin ferrochelatase
VENASRPDQRVLATTVVEMEPAMTQANLTGPALTFIGLAPRQAVVQAQELQEALA